MIGTNSTLNYMQIVVLINCCQLIFNCCLLIAGLFFQWIACSSIMFVAIIIQLIVASTKFYPLAMVGGVLWCTGLLYSNIKCEK